MFSLSKVPRSIKITLFAIIIFTFASSTASVLLQGNHFLLGSYEKLNNDDVKYVNSAKILLNKHTLAYNSGESPSTFIMPGMPFVLSGFMLIFGQGDTAVAAFRVFQSLLQAFSIYLIFVISNHVFNSRAALIASLATALYLPDYFSSGAILSETIFRTLFILILCFSLLALHSRQTRHYVIAAIFIGLACYFKPHTILFPVIWFILWLGQKVSWRMIVKLTAVVSLTLILILLPWWIRNYVTFDEFIPFTESAGNPMLLGALLHDQKPSQAFFEAHPEYDGTRKSLFAGSDEDMAEAAKKIVRFGFTHQPLEYMKWYSYDKIMGLYSGPYYWKTVFGIPGTLVIPYHILAMLAGAAGLVMLLVLAIKQRNLNVWLILLSLGYFTAVYVPFVAFSRYGYPQIFIIFIAAGFFIDKLLSSSWSTIINTGRRESRSSTPNHSIQA